MNFLGYVIAFIALIWAASSFKQFFVKKALEKADAKTAELKEEEQFFTKKIDKKEQHLLEIAAKEKPKSKEEILAFWNDKDKE